MGNLFSSDNEQAEAEVEQHDGKQPPKELPKTPLMWVQSEGIWLFVILLCLTRVKL